jgi:preprotein translocase subunit SecE
MSRLQKKKPVKDRKKRSTDLDNQTDSSADLTRSSTAKSFVATGKMKTNLEKKSVGTKISEPNIFQKSIDFLKEVKVELKKVTWPTRKQTTGTTIVVIIFVFIVSAFLGFFDFGLSKLVQVVLT